RHVCSVNSRRSSYFESRCGAAVVAGTDGLFWSQAFLWACMVIRVEVVGGCRAGRDGARASGVEVRCMLGTGAPFRPTTGARALSTKTGLADVSFLVEQAPDALIFAD